MGCPSPDKSMDPAHLKLRKKKDVRLQYLRGQQRGNAIVRAHMYRSQISKAKQAMQHKMAMEVHQQRSKELLQVQDQVHKQLQQLGQAQLEAAQYAAQRAVDLQQQHERRAELEAAQQVRAHAALLRVREEAAARTHHVEMHRAMREAILASERDKARAMTEDQAEKQLQQEQQQQQVALLEEQRRRRNQHSMVDFSFTRLHEGTPYVNPVESAKVEMDPVPDPVETAKQTMTRRLEEESEKAIQAALAEERAQQRFAAAQAKIRSDKQRKQLEAQLEAAAAEERERRKRAAAEGRGQLLDQRKQQELERIFEDNFINPAAVSTSIRVQGPAVVAYLPGSSGPQPQQQPDSLDEQQDQPRQLPGFLKAKLSKSAAATAAVPFAAAIVTAPGIMPSHASIEGHARSAAHAASASAAGVAGPAVKLPGLPPLPVPYWSKGRNARLGRPGLPELARQYEQHHGHMMAMIPPSGIPLPMTQQQASTQLPQQQQRQLHHGMSQIIAVRGPAAADAAATTARALADALSFFRQRAGQHLVGGDDMRDQGLGTMEDAEGQQPGGTATELQAQERAAVAGAASNMQQAAESDDCGAPAAPATDSVNVMAGGTASLTVDTQPQEQGQPQGGPHALDPRSDVFEQELDRHLEAMRRQLSMTEPQQDLLQQLMPEAGTSTAAARLRSSTTASSSGSVPSELEALLLRAAAKQGPAGEGIAAALAGVGLLPGSAAASPGPAASGSAGSISLRPTVSSLSSSSSVSLHPDAADVAESSLSSGTTNTISNPQAGGGLHAMPVTTTSRRYLAGIDLASLLAPLPPVAEVEDEEEGVHGMSGGDPSGTSPAQALSRPQQKLAAASPLAASLSSLSDTVSSSIDRLLFGGLLSVEADLSDLSSPMPASSAVPPRVHRGPSTRGHEVLDDDVLSSISSLSIGSLSELADKGIIPQQLAPPFPRSSAAVAGGSSRYAAAAPAAAGDYEPDSASSVITELSQLAREGEMLAARIKAAMSASAGPVRLPFVPQRQPPMSTGTWQQQPAADASVQQPWQQGPLPITTAAAAVSTLDAMLQQSLQRMGVQPAGYAGGMRVDIVTDGQAGPAAGMQVTSADVIAAAPRYQYPNSALWPSSGRDTSIPSTGQTAAGATFDSADAAGTRGAGSGSSTAGLHSDMLLTSFSFTGTGSDTASLSTIMAGLATTVSDSASLSTIMAGVAPARPSATLWQLPYGAPRDTAATVMTAGRSTLDVESQASLSSSSFTGSASGHASLSTILEGGDFVQHPHGGPATAAPGAVHPHPALHAAPASFTSNSSSTMLSSVEYVSTLTSGSTSSSTMLSLGSSDRGPALLSSSMPAIRGSPAREQQQQPAVLVGSSGQQQQMSEAARQHAPAARGELLNPVTHPGPSSDLDLFDILDLASLDDDLLSLHPLSPEQQQQRAALPDTPATVPVWASLSGASLLQALEAAQLSPGAAPQGRNPADADGQASVAAAGMKDSVSMAGSGSQEKRGHRQFQAGGAGGEAEDLEDDDEWEEAGSQGEAGGPRSEAAQVEGRSGRDVESAFLEIVGPARDLQEWTMHGAGGRGQQPWVVGGGAELHDAPPITGRQQHGQGQQLESGITSAAAPSYQPTDYNSLEDSFEGRDTANEVVAASASPVAWKHREQPATSAASRYAAAGSMAAPLAFQIPLDTSAADSIDSDGFADIMSGLLHDINQGLAAMHVGQQPAAAPAEQAASGHAVQHIDISASSTAGGGHSRNADPSLHREPSFGDLSALTEHGSDYDQQHLYNS